MNPKEVFHKMADVGVRIFSLTIHGCAYKRDETYLVHPNKTTEEWREDVRAFRGKGVFTQDDYADDVVYNGLVNHLRDLGYIEIEDVVADVFEGRISCTQAQLVDDPVHDDIQADGFGHYGWESK